MTDYTPPNPKRRTKKPERIPKGKKAATESGNEQPHDRPPYLKARPHGQTVEGVFKLAERLKFIFFRFETRKTQK